MASVEERSGANWFCWSRSGESSVFFAKFWNFITYHVFPTPHRSPSLARPRKVRANTFFRSRYVFFRSFAKVCTFVWIYFFIFFSTSRRFQSLARFPNKVRENDFFCTVRPRWALWQKSARKRRAKAEAEAEEAPRWIRMHFPESIPGPENLYLR